MKNIERVTDRLARGDLQREYFFKILNACEYLGDFEIDSVESLNCLGLDTSEIDGKITLNTKRRDRREQKFCVVDIETNGCSLQESKVIEIGAVMLQNSEIIDEFSSLIFAENLPETIVNLTGITDELLRDAPSEASVLEKFRLFLGNSVFVAHNVEFDYTFLSHAFKRHGNAPLLNRKLCTIKLASKTIEAQKYGLATLREVLGITDGVLHRAFWDAKSAAEIFVEAVKKLPKEVVTTEDLINFTKMNLANMKTAKRPRLPFRNEEI